MDVQEMQEDVLDEEVEHKMSILMLNEYCLLEIFSYLQIEEVFRMEDVCTRFLELSQRIYLSTRNLDINKLHNSNVAMPDAMRIMRRIGQNIHNLTAEQCSIALNKGEIPRFTYHKVNASNIIVQHDGGEAFAFQSVKRAKITWCGVSDEQLGYLLPLDQIEVLNIAYTHGLKGMFFKSLKNIIELDMSGVDHLNPEVFKEFCEITPNLRSLTISMTHILQDDLHAIAQNLRNLEKLSLSNYFYAEWTNFREIAQLPKLNHLELHQYQHEGEFANEEFNTPIDLSELLLLVSHHNRLETLYYSGWPSDRDHTIFSTINRALAKLTNLRILHLHFLYTESFGSNNLLQKFTAKHKLEKLVIETPNIFSHELEMFIKRCVTIKLIIVSRSKLSDMSFLNNIQDCLSQRSHVLEIRLPKVQEKLCMDLINGKVFQNLKLVFK